MDLPLTNETLNMMSMIGVIMLMGIGWTGAHVFNPDWHPHGRFHAAQLVSFVTAMSVLDFLLVWRHSQESRFVMVAATAFPVLFRGAEFFRGPPWSYAPAPDRCV